jgi:hypothetical protein
MKEFDYFKSDECNSLFRIWISNFPESFHQLDLERFTNLVIALLDNDEDLEHLQITKSTKKLEEWQVDSYMNKFHAMKEIYIKLKGRWI